MERRICYIESLIKLAGFSKLSGGKLSLILSNNHAKNHQETTRKTTLIITQETTRETTQEMPEKTSKLPEKPRKELLKTLEKTEDILLADHCKWFIHNELTLLSRGVRMVQGVLGFLKWGNYPDKKVRNLCPKKVYY